MKFQRTNSSATWLEEKCALVIIRLLIIRESTFGHNIYTFWFFMILRFYPYLLINRKDIISSQFCFCRLDFDTKIVRRPGGTLSFAETSSFSTDCASMKLPSDFNQHEVEKGILLNLQKAAQHVSCWAS